MGEVMPGTDDRPERRDLGCSRPHACDSDPDSYDLWLDPCTTNAAAAPGLLKPFDAKSMRCYPISTRINGVRTMMRSVRDLSTTESALCLALHPVFAGFNLEIPKGSRKPDTCKQRLRLFQSVPSPFWLELFFVPAVSKLPALLWR
jgi:hypothetical protein